MTLTRSHRTCVIQINYLYTALTPTHTQSYTQTHTQKHMHAHMHSTHTHTLITISTIAIMVDVGSASAKLYMQSAISTGIVVTSAWYSENCRQPMLQSRLAASCLHIWLFRPIGAHQCSVLTNHSILHCHVSSLTGSVL